MNHPSPIILSSPIIARQLPQWRDHDVLISVQRKKLLGSVITVLLHLLLFWILARSLNHTLGAQGGQPKPIYLQLGPLKSLQLAQEKPAAPPKSAPPKPSPRAIHPTIRHSEPVPESMSPLVASTEPEAKPTPPTPIPPQVTDMQSYIKAMREQRQAASGAPQEAQPQSEDARRMANIMRNLQQPGTSGVFQILSKTARNAQFIFRGWKGDQSRARSEQIDVELGMNEDIEHAIIRRMIVLIRREYSGNFNWDSQRLGRIVTLSARVEDTAGLEDFMMKEFFGGPSGSRY